MYKIDKNGRKKLTYLQNMDFDQSCISSNLGIFLIN